RRPKVAAHGGDPRSSRPWCSVRVRRYCWRGGLRCRAALEEDEDDHGDDGHERCRPVLATATTGLSPRLLDQRLDEGFDLLTFERFVRTIRARWARWRGDGHACLLPN